MDTEIQLYGFILNMIGWTFLLCWSLLWIRRRPGNLPRYCLAATYFIGWLHFTERLIAFCHTSAPMPEVLSLSYVFGGVLGIATVYLYPIAVINSQWLVWKRGVLLVAPWIVVAVLLSVLPLEFRPLYSFGELAGHIREFNVWCRLLLTGVIPVYAFFLFYVPYNWMKSGITHRWIYYYTLWGLTISFFYMIFILTGSLTVICIHHTVCLLFCLVMTYQELFIRIAVPAEKTKEPLPLQTPSASLPAEDMAAATAMREEVNEEPETTACHPLWDQLNKLMKHEELWRNPDLSLEDLAARLGTNRTTLTQVIQRESKRGYKEYINRFRMEEFVKIINAKPRLNIQEEFFKVGFRSKVTALRHFKEYTGLTPTDYLRKIAGED